MTGPLLSKIHAFLGKLREGRREDIHDLLKAVKNDDMSLILKTMGIVIEDEKEKVSDELISDNFLQLLVDLLDWERLSTNPEFLLHVYSLTTMLGNHYPDRRIALEGMGIVEKLLAILDKERESKTMICVQKNGATITACHFIANFIPVLPHSRCYEDVNNINSCGLLKSGPQFDETHKGVKEWIFNERDDEYNDYYDYHGQPDYSFLPHVRIRGEGNSYRAIYSFSKRIQEHVKVIFKTVHNICQSLNSCHSVHHILLLKVIFWANAADELNNCGGISEIVSLTQMLLSSTHEREKVIVGMAIIHTLISKHMNSFQSLKQAITNMRSTVGVIDWIEDICDIFSDDDLLTPKMLVYCFQDQTFYSTSHLRNDLINSMTLYVKPSHGKCRLDFKDSDRCRNYSQLSTFMRILLKLPRNTGKIQETFTVSDEAVQVFKRLVSFVIKALEANRVEIIFDRNCNDCSPFGKRISFPQEVCLGLFYSFNLDSILGSTDYTKEESYTDIQTLLQCLTLILIFHELNENWGVLFCVLTPERLIDTTHFISQRFTEYVKQFILEHDGKKSPFTEDYTLFDYIKNYYYLLPFDVRRYMIMEYLKCENEIEVEYIIPRENLLDDTIKKLPIYRFYDSVWNLRFVGEPGTGSGPTKEFYTEFSRECYRYDLDEWIGDPIEDSDGNVYVNAPCGLFPKPKISRNKESVLKYKAISNVLHKCFENGHQMDVNFSKAFYKLVFGHSAYQRLSLIDLKDVMPNVYKLVENLVNALRMKWGIERDGALTTEKRVEAISNITCDGSSFQDLCINFTIPCFPEMEMKEGGKDILLSIENVEEYLKLLVWWLLIECPKYVGDHCIGGNFFTESETVLIFNMDEIETLFCGSNAENWTVDFLKSNCCLLDGFSIDNPVINYLFEVLVSLSKDEQRKFLQFTTGSTRLPFGGLKNLSPKLTIRRKLSFGTPDKYLPVSWTCSNTLFITDYSSKEILREKLLYAIREGNKSFYNF